MDIDEIKEIKKYLIDEYHLERVKRQKRVQEFIDDTFDVPTIKSPQYVCRTGLGAELINGPISHIITRNPQVFVDAKKSTKGALESALKVNAMENHWVRQILRQSPQPFSEFTRNLMARGEAWLHPVLNEGWKPSIEDERVLPMFFLTPDPLVIFGSPNEFYGIPEYVVVFYERVPRDVRKLYPKWSDPNNASGSRDKKVEWFEYWDSKVRYFEADGEPVLKGGIQKNLYGFVPFIHAYSGFGKEDNEGRPESLVVSRIAPVKDLLIQECAINSYIDSMIHKFARPKRDLILPLGAEVDEGTLKENYDMSAGSFNVLSLPDGYKFDPADPILPSQEAFQHYYNLRSRIASIAPPVMSGLPSGSSGRQEDIVGYHFVRRFDSIVEATEDAFAKALDMGSEILKKVPTWLPITQWLEQPDGGKKEITITEADLNACARSQVKLKAADPIEDDRKLMAGRALYDAGLIDWGEFLVNYAGYTPEKAQEIIDQTIADKVVIENPLLFQALSEKALENLGMSDYLERLREQAQQAPQGGVGSQGGPPRQFNERTPEAREMVDLQLSQRGVRRSPEVV